MATEINWSHPSSENMRQWTGSELVQVMACRPFGTTSLPEPMLSYIYRFIIDNSINVIDVENMKLSLC